MSLSGHAGRQLPEEDKRGCVDNHARNGQSGSVDADGPRGRSQVYKHARFTPTLSHRNYRTAE
jgi:hypothetical protein